MATDYSRERSESNGPLDSQFEPRLDVGVVLRKVMMGIPRLPPLLRLLQAL